MLHALVPWLRRLHARRAKRPVQRPCFRPSLEPCEERVPASESVGPYVIVSALGWSTEVAGALTAPLYPADAERPDAPAAGPTAFRIDLTAAPEPAATPAAVAVAESAPLPAAPDLPAPDRSLPLEQLTFSLVLDPAAPGDRTAARASAALSGSVLLPPDAAPAGDPSQGGGPAPVADAGAAGGTAAATAAGLQLPLDQATLEALAGDPGSPVAPSERFVESPPAPPPPSASRSVAPSATAARARTLSREFGKLPLRFEVNRGQSDPRVRYLSRGLGYTLFLTDSAEAVFTFNRPPTTPRPSPVQLGRPPAASAPAPRPVQDVLRLRFLGANAAPRVAGHDELPERTNYLRGPAWQTDLPNYARVTYEDLYPGVNVAYYGTDDRQLEYDLIVKPGADPARVRFSFAGAASSTIDSQGRLVLQLAGGGTVVQQAPVVYQVIDGRRREVVGRHRLLADGQVGFDVQGYNPAHALVIDPVVGSTYLGSSGPDWAEAVAVDPSGNIYLAGTATWSDFPTVDGLATTFAGPSDAFVVKLDPTGTTALFSTFFGAAGDDSAYDVAVDPSGAVFLTGKTAGGVFPEGTFLNTFGGGASDAFVARLSATGDVVRYGRFYGDADNEEGRGIEVDVEGSAYVTGIGNATVTGSLTDVFALKVAPDGTGPVYQVILAGSDHDRGEAIAVDPAGYAYVAGRTYSGDFLTGTPGWRQALAGPSDAFVARLDPWGVVLAATTFGGAATTIESVTYTGDEEATDLALDHLGDSTSGAGRLRGITRVRPRSTRVSPCTRFRTRPLSRRATAGERPTPSRRNSSLTS